MWCISEYKNIQSSLTKQYVFHNNDSIPSPVKYVDNGYLKASVIPTFYILEKNLN